MEIYKGANAGVEWYLWGHISRSRSRDGFALLQCPQFRKRGGRKPIWGYYLAALLSAIVPSERIDNRIPVVARSLARPSRHPSFVSSSLAPWAAIIGNNVCEKRFWISCEVASRACLDSKMNADRQTRSANAKSSRHNLNYHDEQITFTLHSAGL